MKSTIKNTPDQVHDKDTIEEWIGDLCRNVASTKFHNYLNDLLISQGILQGDPQEYQGVW